MLITDDRIGHQSLANNDDDVGLGYAKGGNQLLLAGAKVLTVDELPRLCEQSTINLQENEEEND